MPAGDMPQGEPPPEEAQETDTGGVQQASPEEQAQYDQFVGRAMEVIYNKKMFPHVVEMLRGGGNDGQDKQAAGPSGPAQGLANATALIVTRVYKAAADARTNISPDVLFHGGTEIFQQLAEISDKAKISNYAKDRDALEGAYFVAIDKTTEQLKQSGVIDEAEAKAAMQQLQEMDQKGEVESLFRELDEKDRAGQGGEAERPDRGEQEPPANDNSMKGGMAPPQSAQEMP